ncbi:hypothetical protein [Phenylobacterium sp.]|uniref:hypothetical protein n=1 Tax=Phenylobacterium sp. TaxID=1871053 RepID=UPI002FCB2DED
MTRAICVGEGLVELRPAGDGLLARGFAGDAYLAARLKGDSPTAAICGLTLAARVVGQHGAIIASSSELSDA